MVRLEHEVLQSVLKPSRCTGGEWNAVRKDWSEVDCTFALALPDTMTRSPNALAIGTAICPKLPEPPGINSVSPGLARNSSVIA